MTLEPAPAGQRVAYLRKVGSFAMAGTKVKAIIGVEAIDELVVYDLARGRQVVEICEACSVDAGSLRWSPSGRQLYFSARYRQGDGFDHRHRSDEPTSELQSLMRISYAVFCLKKQTNNLTTLQTND